MYLRSTKRKNKDGSCVEYYQLAHNERHPKTRKPVAKIIHNFGRADQLDRQELVRLCQSIARVCGLIITDPHNDAWSETAGIGPVHNLKIKKTLALGCPWVIEAMWEQLGLKKTLADVAKTAGAQAPYERALLAMVANRLCDPESKLGVWDRWLSTVHLPSCQGLKLRHMYEAMDLLHAHARQVEKTVFFQIADLFNLEVDLIFYDTTTASFSVDAEDEPGRHPNATLRKSGQLRIDKAAIREAEKYDGKWVIETNDDTISLEDAACGYKGLMVIERCFRSLKRTQIKMTPMYHWASRRIEAHVKICVLSLLIERMAELKCGKPWPRIRRALEKLQVTEIFDLNLRVLMRNEPPRDTLNVLRSLKIQPPNQVVCLEKHT